MLGILANGTIGKIQKKKKLLWSRVDGNRLGWKVETNVGQFSFLMKTN
jgi:hypothetical protein